MSFFLLLIEGTVDTLSTMMFSSAMMSWLCGSVVPLNLQSSELSLAFKLVHLVGERPRDVIEMFHVPCCVLLGDVADQRCIR